MRCARPCTPIPPLHACSMLTRWTLCRRSLPGRILESNDISHTGVGSERRAYARCRDRARAREAVARGCGRSVSCMACSGRQCRPRSKRVVAARALSCTCMSSALRLSRSAPPARCPSVSLHPRAYSCVVPMSGWPAGGLRELCSVCGAYVQVLTVCARSFEMGLEPRLTT